MNITDQIQSTSVVKRKRFTYSEQNKMKIVKYANECGLTRAVGKYKGEFSSLRESTVRGWLNKYRSQLEKTYSVILESFLLMSLNNFRP